MRLDLYRRFKTHGKKAGSAALSRFAAVLAAAALIYSLPGCSGPGNAVPADTAVTASDETAVPEVSLSDAGQEELPASGSDVSPSDDDGEYVPPIENPSAGDIFYFGSYIQSGSEPEPIAWRVLKKEKDRALVISERILDCKPYNKENVRITWKDCSLRQWLNGEFLETAFTPRERKGILLVTNQPDSKHEMTEFGEEETEDYIFCLSKSEAKKYFKKDADRLAAPTEYAKKRGSWVNEESLTSDGLPATWWILRSQGSSGVHMHLAAYVNNAGEIDEYGRDVSDTVSVRPAFWIDLEG